MWQLVVLSIAVLWVYNRADLEGVVLSISILWHSAAQHSLAHFVQILSTVMWLRLHSHYFVI